MDPDIFRDPQVNSDVTRVDRAATLLSTITILSIQLQVADRSSVIS